MRCICATPSLPPRRFRDIHLSRSLKWNHFINFALSYKSGSMPYLENTRNMLNRNRRIRRDGDGACVRGRHSTSAPRGMSLDTEINNTSESGRLANIQHALLSRPTSHLPYEARQRPASFLSDIFKCLGAHRHQAGKRLAGSCGS